MADPRSRRQNTSSESYQPELSAAFIDSVTTSAQLLSLLEQEDSASEVPQLPQLSDVEAQLQRMLSIHSLVSTTSSFAAKEQAAAEPQFAKIGAGSCGVIFAFSGKSLVIKLAKSKDDALWNDYEKHARVEDAFNKMKRDIELMVKVPKCHGYIGNDNGKIFWDQHDSLTKAAAEADMNVPTWGLISERILPLTRPTQEHLIGKFCPEKAKTAALAAPANRDCLARVYLGKTVARRPSSMFTLRNIALHLNELEALQIDVRSIASEMGKCLAVLHWEARVDGRDVEFVLGSEAAAGPFMPRPSGREITKLRPHCGGSGPTAIGWIDFYHRRTCLWLLDFNQVQDLKPGEEGLLQAVEAYRINDFYFPRPLQPSAIAKIVWNSFVKAYLAASSQILAATTSDDRALPPRFIQLVIDAQTKHMRTN